MIKNNEQPRSLCCGVVHLTEYVMKLATKKPLKANKLKYFTKPRAKNLL